MKLAQSSLAYTTLFVLCSVSVTAGYADTVFSLEPHVAFEHNQPDALRAELADTNLHLLIAKSAGLTQDDLDAVRIDLNKTGVPELWFERLTEDTNVYLRFGNQLANYLEARRSGHTKECVAPGLNNQPSPTKIEDDHLRALVTELSVIPPSSFIREEAGRWTNSPFDVTMITDENLKKAIAQGQLVISTNEEHGSWVSFKHMDDDLAWSYQVRLRDDGSLKGIISLKYDVKETLPEFQEIFKEVDQEVREEFESQKREGRIGSFRPYWEIKKEKLKARGIEWRSRNELNPEMIPYEAQEIRGWQRPK